MSRAAFEARFSVLPKDAAGGRGDALKQISDWAKDARALIESSETLQSAASTVPDAKD